MAGAFCPRCGAQRTGSYRFCASCAFDFEDPQLAVAPGPAAQAPAEPATPPLSAPTWGQPPPPGAPTWGQPPPPTGPAPGAPSPAAGSGWGPPPTTTPARSFALACLVVAALIVLIPFIAIVALIFLGGQVSQILSDVGTSI